MRSPDAKNRDNALRSNYTLLERLRADDLQVELPGRDPLSVRLESIGSSLMRLLNTRCGLSSSSATYGLEDFNDAAVGSADMMRVVARDIERAIRENEPRVSHVQVLFERGQTGSTELFFKILATTMITRKSEQVMIDLVLSNGRNFRLR